MSRFRALLICNSYRDCHSSDNLSPMPDALNDGATVEKWLWEHLRAQQDKEHDVRRISDLDADEMVTEITALGKRVEGMEQKPLVRPFPASCVRMHRSLHVLSAETMHLTG
jgi:hypothetical protein